MKQLSLTGDATPPEVRVTLNQRQALDAIRNSAGGLTDDELGALIHERRLADGRIGHTTANRCAYCSRDGSQMGKALRAKGLIVKRRASRRWQAVEAQTPLVTRIGPGSLPEEF